MVSDPRGEFFVDSPADYRRTLRFLVEAVDEEYSDELGGPQMQILGVSTCGKGADTSYHLVYLVGLGDPGSTSRAIASSGRTSSPRKMGGGRSGRRPGGSTRTGSWRSTTR